MSKVQFIIVSLTACNKTLKPKEIENLKTFKKSFSDQHRINILIGEINRSVDNYKRPSNNTTEKKLHCSMVNALVERLGKDFIKAKTEEEYKNNPTGQRVIAILKKNDLSFNFRTTTVVMKEKTKVKAKAFEPEMA